MKICSSEEYKNRTCTNLNIQNAKYNELAAK